MTGITVTVKWDFTCVGCEHYQTAKEKGKMGYCPIMGRKVAKTFGCRESTILRAFVGALVE